MKGVIGLSEQMYLLQYLVMSLDGLSTGIMMEILYRKSYPKRGCFPPPPAADPRS